MSNKVKVVSLLIGIVLSIRPQLYPASSCGQTFTFFGATMGAFKQDDITFWIGEDVSGECFSSHLIQVTISDTVTNTVVTNNLEYGEWAWFKRGFKSFGVPLCKELRGYKERWVDGSISFDISVPTPDSELVRQLNEAYRVGLESDWTRSHGLQGIVAPKVKGIKTKITYYYTDGLYIGYEISTVYYMPTFRYIIIFTHQPRLKSGLDTMHGFLILKITH